MKTPNRKEIEEVIEKILVFDGPDGHIDGADVITDFIEALLLGEHEKWLKEYKPKHGKAPWEK